jgi:hypothetical protein
LVAAVLCLATVRGVIGWIGNRTMPDLAAIAMMLALLATIMALTGASPA